MARRRSIGAPGVALVTFLIVVVGMELWMRAIEPRLPLQAGMWPRAEMGLKYEQMREVQASGQAPEVLFAGSSMTASGVDPNAFTRTSGLESYNSAFAGPGMRSLDRWVLEVAEPMFSPRTVVLGLQSRELNDDMATTDRFFEVLRSAPGFQLAAASTFPDRVERWLDDTSAFYRNRRALRTPATLFQQKVDQRGHQLGPRGARVQQTRAYRHKLKADRIAGVPFRNPGRVDVKTAPRSFEIGGEEISALEHTAVGLRDRGVRLIVVVMPVTLDYGYADAVIRQRFFAALERVARTHEITVVDAQDAFPKQGPFRDPIHLDVEGRAALGGELGRLWPRITGGSGFWRLRCSLEFTCGIGRLDDLRPSRRVTPGRRHGYLCAPNTPRLRTTIDCEARRAR